MDSNYSSGHPPYLLSVALTALAGIPRELSHRRDRFQLQLLILEELINNRSTEFGPHLNLLGNKCVANGTS